MYIRFVIGTDSQNAYWLDGVIGSARRDLLDAGELHRHECEFLNQTFDWLNENLPHPPFHEKLRSGEWSRDAVSWFRDDAREPMRKIWDIVALLQEHGIWVRMFKTNDPGRIVYSDEYQVVAETPSWA